MNSPYDVLGIVPGASYEEIRDAYRRQVKQVHPDLHGGDPQSVERMKAVLAAWEVLRDPTRRTYYESATGEGRGFDYAHFLRARTDPHSRAKLVFYDLLHDNPTEALAIYDALVRVGDYELSRYLGREDFMDCAFLLAEEYERHDALDRAVLLLEAIVRFESERPYFRHFMQDVYERVREVVARRMPQKLPARHVIETIRRVVSWDLPPKELAYYYKRLAELYVKSNDRGRAQRSLRRAVAIDPRITGTKALEREIARMRR